MDTFAISCYSKQNYTIGEFQKRIIFDALMYFKHTKKREFEAIDTNFNLWQIKKINKRFLICRNNDVMCMFSIVKKF